MIDLVIGPYSPRDDADALALEAQCVQGTSLRLKFRRPNFRARSELYENHRIYCAHRGAELIGIIAGALKDVKLHGATVRALYVYDLRVHPAHRRSGVGKRLTNVLINDLGRSADCIYTLINGENKKALSLACLNFDPRAVIPLTYSLIPVYKERKEKAAWKSETAKNNHAAFLRSKESPEFLSVFDDTRLAGHVMSLDLKGPARAGCSIWTNEELLAEQVTRIPFRLSVLRILSRPLKPFVRLPHIPARDEIIHSWFLFDLYADDARGLKSLLAAVNNQALARGRTYLYILLQDSDPLLPLLRDTGLKYFSFPYRFLAKGRTVPRESDRIHIDIRDL